jgi:hypothetical protein
VDIEDESVCVDCGEIVVFDVVELGVKIGVFDVVGEFGTEGETVEGVELGC